MPRIALLFAPFALLCASCDLLGKTVSEDDCVKWDEHYRKALEKAAKRRAKACDESDSPAAKTYQKSLEENVASNADGMASACRSIVKVGGYTAAEEKCFLSGDDPKDWSKCSFKSTSAVGMYAKSADTLSKTIESMCGSDSSSKKGDDEDAPKKKKSKGDDE